MKDIHSVFSEARLKGNRFIRTKTQGKGKKENSLLAHVKGGGERGPGGRQDKSKAIDLSSFQGADAPSVGGKRGKDEERRTCTGCCSRNKGWRHHRTRMKNQLGANDFNKRRNAMKQKKKRVLGGGGENLSALGWG